jgi:hypothetical protein
VNPDKSGYGAVGIGRTRSRGHSRCAVRWSLSPHPGPLPFYVFSVIAARANGARTLVRRKVGRRQCLETSQRGSAVPTFLRDKSRAPGQLLVRALNRYLPLGEGGPYSSQSTLRTFWLSLRGARGSLSPCRRRAGAALFRLRLWLRRDRVEAKRRWRRAAKAEGRGSG